jgi:hypothetical protein
MAAPQPQRVSRVRAWRALMVEGPAAARAGLTAAECPYNLMGGAADRALARLWIRGFSRARNVVAKQDRATQGQ